MPNRNHAHKLNVPGLYFVDDHCIRCSACAVRASDYFDINKEGAFVKKQPATAEGKEICDKALFNCPAKAIGKN